MLKKAFKLLTKYPITGNIIIYTGLYGAGDISRQIVTKENKLQCKSVKNMAIVGGVIFGPLYHYWYTYLDRILPGKTKGIILRKVVLDQVFIGGPSVILFYVALSILEFKKDFLREALDKGPMTFATGCLYWPSAQTLNFYFVSNQFRAIYVAFAEFVWTNLLSFYKASQSFDS